MAITNNQSLLREKSHIEDNPIGLEDDVVRQIIPALDKHVSSMFVLFHQYQKHHWMVEGPQFRDLHLYLEEAYNEVHRHLDDVAERITVLGGIPTCDPVAQAENAYVKHEEEGVFPVRQSLQNDLEMERKIAENLRKGIEQARELADYGTEHLLKKVLHHSEERAHHLDHYLASDSLEKR